MEIKVTGRHLDATPAMREYAETKVAKLPRYFDRVQQIDVVLDRINSGYQVEVIVQAEHVDPFVSKVSGPDLYACIDETVDKLERQLTDHKEKLRNRKHPASR